MLEQFRISDFLEWHNAKTLKLNPDFQRGSVWTPAARIMLIDTILRDLPVPKIFIRSKIDRETKRSVREVVDGQQRLRAIIDFANDKMTLSSRTKEFTGYRFSTLDPDLQDKFLEYPLAVDQLINASNSVVLDIFARLNSYNVRLTAPELRHAAYQGDFRNSVHDVAAYNVDMWTRYGTFSTREMVRLESDAFIAELAGIILDGVNDGGAPRIDRIYKKYDPEGSYDKTSVEEQLIQLLELLAEILDDGFKDRAITQPPHLLMLLAGMAHSVVGIPQGKLDALPPRQALISDKNALADRLADISTIIEAKSEPETLKAFWNASKSSTQRIASRKVRFPVYYSLLTEEAWQPA